MKMESGYEISGLNVECFFGGGWASWEEALIEVHAMGLRQPGDSGARRSRRFNSKSESRMNVQDKMILPPFRKSRSETPHWPADSVFGLRFSFGF
jgi:hypothetical protein